MTSITPSATIGAGTWDLGFNDDMVSKTIPLDYRSSQGAVVGSIETGTVAWTYEITYDDVNQPEDFTWTDQSTPVWHTSSAALTGSAPGTVLEVGAKAMRVHISAYTDGGELQVWVTQTSHPV